MRRLTERTTGASPEVDWKTVQSAGEFIEAAAGEFNDAAKSVQKDEIQAAASRLLLNLEHALEAIPGLDRVAAAVGKAADEVRPTRRSS